MAKPQQCIVTIDDLFSTWALVFVSDQTMGTNYRILTQAKVWTQWFKRKDDTYELRLFGGEDAGCIMPELKDKQDAAKEKAQCVAAPMHRLQDSSSISQYDTFMESLSVAKAHLETELPALHQLHELSLEKFQNQKNQYTKKQDKDGHDRLNTWQEVCDPAMPNDWLRSCAASYCIIVVHVSCNLSARN